VGVLAASKKLRRDILKARKLIASMIDDPFPVYCAMQRHEVTPDATIVAALHHRDVRHTVWGENSRSTAPGPTPSSRKRLPALRQFEEFGSYFLPADARQ
jgi:hypothetical protein